MAGQETKLPQALTFFLFLDPGWDYLTQATILTVTPFFNSKRNINSGVKLKKTGTRITAGPNFSNFTEICLRDMHRCYCIKPSMRGYNFDPVRYLNEVITWRRCKSFCLWSTWNSLWNQFMVTWFQNFRISLLIHS